MAIAAAVKIVDYTRRKKKLVIALTFSGSYSTGGDTLNFTTMTNPSFVANANVAKIPSVADVVFQNGAGGYDFDFVPGTTLANSKIKIFSAANTELAAGAYNAALTGDTLNVEINRPIYGG
jgi:hypothetical protein